MIVPLKISQSLRVIQLKGTNEYLFKISIDLYYINDITLSILNYINNKGIIQQFVRFLVLPLYIFDSYSIYTTAYFHYRLRHHSHL